MEKSSYEKALQSHAVAIEAIRQAAHELHASVNQHYNHTLPYGYHLDGVADGVRRFGHDVCQQEADVLPLFFGAYFHDSMEDARQTYNDVMATARHFLDERQALLATEIAYALTNEKGRTRAERANEKYYQGIRQTPYAPFVKLCDRLANATFSNRAADGGNSRMANVYAAEMPHFIAALQAEGTDPRLQLPDAAVEALYAAVKRQTDHFSD